MTTRTASTRWTGGIAHGQGTTTLESSAAGEFTVSLPARSGDPLAPQTSPEELIAAAQSACLAMNLSGVLESEGLRPETIDVRATVTLGQSSQGGFEISAVDIEVGAAVPGVDAVRFSQLAELAERTCPVSRLLSGTRAAKVTMRASLD